MVGARSGELLTYAGKVIIHGSKAELEWVFPNARIVRVTEGSSLGPTIQLKDHPQIKDLGVSFPLKREQWR